MWTKKTGHPKIPPFLLSVVHWASILYRNICEIPCFLKVYITAYTITYKKGAQILDTLSFNKLYNKSYFEAGRRPRKRSLLNVNEHFEAKPDAERALFDNFFTISAG